MSGIVVKVFFGEETHRLVFSSGAVRFEDLVGKIATRLAKDKNLLLLKYEDQEQDRITLTCDEDVLDALHVAKDMKATSLKVYVSLKTDPVEKDDGAFVLLHSDEPKQEESEQVSFEELNADFQKMLDARLQAAEAEFKSSHESLISPAEPSPAESSPAVVNPAFPSLAESPKAEEKKEEVGVAVHSNVTCDGCQKSPIEGVRFKCVECFNFDLCGDCEARGVHPLDHPMLKIKVPRTQEIGRGLRSCRKTCGGKFGRSFAKFVEDVTIPDRSNCAPGDVREKVWRLQNVGSNDWPAGFKVMCISGDEVLDASSKSLTLPVVKAGDIFEVKVKINAPTVPGRYVANFRLLNLNGEKFGPKFWVDFYVPEVSEVKRPAVKPEAAAPAPAPAPVQKSAGEIKYEEQLSVLSSLGFEDTGLNIYLLDKFDGKSERVVHWLLDRARSN